jgi:hypothetical protein
MQLFIGSVLLATLVWAVQPTGGAENVPPSGPSVPPPSSEIPPPEAEAAPPSQDPGIVKKPDVEPLPGSVVVPPVVDPKIAVNPEEPRRQESPTPSEREPEQRQPDQPSR